MSSAEDCAALRARLAQLRKETAALEERLASLPFDDTNAPLRDMTIVTLGQLHLVEQDMQRLIQAAEEHVANSEGGKDNGKCD